MTLEILNKDWSIWQILSGDFWLNAITLQNPARLQDGFFLVNLETLKRIIILLHLLAVFY